MTQGSSRLHEGHQDFRVVGAEISFQNRTQASINSPGQSESFS